MEFLCLLSTCSWQGALILSYLQEKIQDRSTKEHEPQAELLGNFFSFFPKSLNVQSIEPDDFLYIIITVFLAKS